MSQHGIFQDILMHITVIYRLGLYRDVDFIGHMVFIPFSLQIKLDYYYT